MNWPREILSKARRRRGFTLFEIVLTLLIISIAAAMVIPAAANATSPRLRTAANVLAADIDFCSSECIAQPSGSAGDFVRWLAQQVHDD